MEARGAVTKMDEVLALLRSSEGLAGAAARAHLSALAPGLTLGALSGPGTLGGPVLGAAGDSEAATALIDDGFAPLSAVAPEATCARLVDAIERLTAAGLPAMFVYLFDEPWQVGEAVGARVSAILGRRYEVVEDIWAWRIEPGKGRGWPAHRGLSEPLLAREAPELVNTWVALSDVEANRACMHFVPLDEDPSYPAALHVLDAPLSAVRTAPLQAGAALAWNANVLHWGGPCSPDAMGARVSCSFSLARCDALGGLALPRAHDAVTDLRARLDAIARLLVIYGEGQPDVREPVLAWAHASVAMKAAIASLSGPLPVPRTVT
jgi:phytanoyl-CoA dioxygenase PhyH